MNEEPTLTKDDITYALFDIDPAAYYEERFAQGHAVGAAARESPATRNRLTYQKASYLLEALRRCLSETGNDKIKVLEVGCGSGIFGARLKLLYPGIELYGVDMSETCIGFARQNGFDHALACDVVHGMPYEDDMFDFIYTMDFFGHIEFRSKDRMIAEILRITKPGGYGFHGIETGFVPYTTCKPKDPNDVVRKYVYMEGHVGVEPLEDIIARFEPGFETVQAFPFPIRPLLNIDNIMNSKFWGAEFNSAFAEVDNPTSRVAADIVIGWINKHLTERLMAAYGDRLVRSDIPDSGLPALNAVIDSMLQGCGFSMSTFRKKRER